MTVSYDAWLIEEAVFKATRGLPAEDRRAYDRPRVRVYEISDPDERETQFRRLNEEWFRRLGLHKTLERAVLERPGLAARLATCLVIPAASRKEELADLWDASGRQGSEAGGAWSGPCDGALVIRLRPESFLNADELLGFLRHELMHVADMLDPAFQYEPDLPASHAGPSHDNILRDRYRVLWDATIDGRLCRAGLLTARTREIRLLEFARTFPNLGPQTEEEFSRWFEDPCPNHHEMIAFVLAPGPAGTPSRQRDARCPLCLFPVAELDADPERLSAAARREIQIHHPDWCIEDGLCSQCADLYEARAASGWANAPEWSET